MIFLLRFVFLVSLCLLVVLEGFEGKGRNWGLCLLMVHVAQGQDRHDTALDARASQVQICDVTGMRRKRHGGDGDWCQMSLDLVWTWPL